MIPLVRVAGSHSEAGGQLGAALAEQIRRDLASSEQAQLARGYREATIEHLPWVVEELDAAAEAAGVDPLRLFAAGIEELRADAAAVGRCTDLVARSADGHMLVAHNNDEDPGTRDDVVAIEWRIDGEPPAFSIGSGPWLSVGWNEAGLSVTGNELTPNDERVGIPRLMQMRASLACETLQEAVECVLHPARASSYNWVFATPEQALNVEGSATASIIRQLEPGGTLVHTNHYLEPEMARFETDLEYAQHSSARCDSARRLAAGPGPLTLERLRVILSDHEGAPDSLCRHAGKAETVFWCVADVTAGTITYGLGNPCDSEAQEYAFR
ncbi:MAG: C45 family autoproteolytic acyltransferase/hydrolase [Gaiellaceae bacterium]